VKKLSFLILAVILTMTLVACSIKTTKKINVSTEHHHWSYDESTGPEKWGELGEANLVCVNGNEQSPINLEHSLVIEDTDYEGHQIDYEPTTFALQNNGYTVQADATIETSRIVVEGEEYKLAQFHFHTPSEHQFNGKHFDMELHLVHKNKNDELAVIGLMIKAGEENEILAPLWDALPSEKTKEENAQKYLIDLEALLPQNQTSFHYDGSLTTPPCTEEVDWIIFEQPIEMSEEQVQAFKGIFSENNRPVQPLNEREIIKK
jgi:carbonic anhydrase